MNAWDRMRQAHDPALASAGDDAASEAIRRWLLYIDCGNKRIGVLAIEFAATPWDAIAKYRRGVDGLTAVAVQRLPLRAMEITLNTVMLHFIELPRQNGLRGWFGAVIDDDGVCTCRHAHDKGVLRRSLTAVARRVCRNSGEILIWRYWNGIPVDTYSTSI